MFMAESPAPASRLFAAAILPAGWRKGSRTGPPGGGWQRQISRHLGGDFRVQGTLQIRLLPVIPAVFTFQQAPESAQRLQRFGCRAVRRVGVAAHVVGGGVVAEPVGDSLDQGRALVAARPPQGFIQHRRHGEEVVAVHAHAGNAAGHGFLGQRL